MREVSKQDFFAGIGRQNVTPYPTGPWPYVSLWKTPGGEVRGKTELDAITGATSRYWLPDEVKP